MSEAGQQPTHKHKRDSRRRSENKKSVEQCQVSRVEDLLRSIFSASFSLASAGV